MDWERGLPSTAISWVAAAKMRDPKTGVKNLTSTDSYITFVSFFALRILEKK